MVCSRASPDSDAGDIEIDVTSDSGQLAIAPFYRVLEWQYGTSSSGAPLRLAVAPEGGFRLTYIPLSGQGGKMSRLLVSLLAVPVIASTVPVLAQESEFDARARKVEQQMTDDERFWLIISLLGAGGSMPRDPRLPEGIKMSAGYTAGVPRLGIPALQSSDASMGVTNPGYRPDDKGANNGLKVFTLTSTSLAHPVQSKSWRTRPKTSRVCVKPLPTTCACCGSGRIAKLGEDVTETLLRSYPGKGAACVQFNAVYREPEACDVVWLPPERRAEHFAQRVREHENRRRRAAFLAWLKTEREETRP
jgi:hypothetical protein